MVNTVGTCLVAFDQKGLGLKGWVALTAMFAVCVTGVTQHQLLQQRLIAHNGAIQTLEGMLNYMTSLSVVSRRQRQIINSCVSTVEQCNLAPISAWTGITTHCQYEWRQGDDMDDDESKKKL